MRVPGAVVAALLLVAACGGDPTPDAAVESAAPAAVDREPPAFAPGGLETGQVTIDGTAIDYVTVVPAGFEPGDAAPVLLAFPPGGQDLALARSVASGTYLAEAVARGWVVVSPAAPDGRLFFNGSEALVPGLLDWIDSWVDAEGGRLHVAGVSNGGISSFRAAGENPERFQSVLVFPGFPRSDADQAALSELADIPVRMFVGENDTDWVAPMEDALVTLTDQGGDATLVVVPGEGHIIGALRDGARIFDELDAAR